MSAKKADEVERFKAWIVERGAGSILLARALLLTYEDAAGISLAADIRIFLHESSPKETTTCQSPSQTPAP